MPKPVVRNVWGLSAFGEQGVGRVLQILNEALRLAMVGCGTRTITDITAAALVEPQRRG